MMGVISAIEMACWDIVGKELNQPIYNLLGGQVHEKLRSYTYLYPDPDDPVRRTVFDDPERAPIRALEYLEQGFNALKFDPVVPMTAPTPVQLSLEALRTAEMVVKNVREAVGDRCDILVGTHGQMTTSSAIRLARRLEQYDPLWFEEPVPPENRDEMARVARSTTIPIATGERLSTKYEFRELLEKQAAVILQMALGRVGGILEAKKIAGMAEAYYAEIAPHLYCGPDRSCCQHTGRHLQPELPDPGEHRDLGWLPRRDPQGAHPVGGRLHHPSDQARSGRRAGRGGGGEAPVQGFLARAGTARAGAAASPTTPFPRSSSISAAPSPSSRSSASVARRAPGRGLESRWACGRSAGVVAARASAPAADARCRRRSRWRGPGDRRGPPRASVDRATGHVLGLECRDHLGPGPRIGCANAEQLQELMDVLHTPRQCLEARIGAELRVPECAEETVRLCVGERRDAVVAVRRVVHPIRGGQCGTMRVRNRSMPWKPWPTIRWPTWWCPGSWRASSWFQSS